MNKKKLNNFCKKIRYNCTEAKNFKADFLGILKSLQKIYFLLHFLSYLTSIFRKCTYQYYKQLVGSVFLKRSNKNKFMTKFVFKIFNCL